MDSAVVLLTPQLLAVVPVVIGLVAAIRATGLPDRFAPAVSIVLGIAGAFVFPAATVALTVLCGVVVGLAASGLYSAAKTTVAG